MNTPSSRNLYPGTAFRVLCGLFVFCILSLLPFQPNLQANQNAAPRNIYLIEIDGPIHPPVQNFIDRAVNKSERDQAEALIIQLDTPGGLLKSTKKITDRLLNTSIPVVVWVSPAGARAASAGVFITYASHIAAMVETSNIGAAHPVTGQGDDLSDTMKEKVVNDAVAQLKSMARKRGRNPDLVDDFIRESQSLTAKEALDKNAIDFLANDRQELLRKITVDEDETSSEPYHIARNSTVKEITMTWREEFFRLLLNPGVIYLMMMMGFFGIMFELSEPGLGFGIVIGGICLLLSFYGMGVFPINFTGILLVLLGLGLMLLDVFIPTFGILTAGGAVAFVFGSMALFDHPAITVSWPFILVASLLSLGSITALGYLLIRARLFTDEHLLDETGSVRIVLNPEGLIYINGSYKHATAADEETISSGTNVRVSAIKNGSLMVQKIDSS